MKVYILSAKRTAIGKFKGCFSQTSAVDLGSAVIKSLLQESQLSPKEIEECIVGQVLTAGQGQAPARQSALKAGLSPSTVCTTVNKVCGSGLKAVQMACDSITLGRAGIVIAGGQENMSLAPHLLKGSRQGSPGLGDWPLIDSLLQDGLINPYDQKHMGQIAELCASRYQFTKEDQNTFAKESFKKVLKAQEQGFFKEEIVPVNIISKKESFCFDKDEQPSKKDYDRIDTARAVFEKQGCITAGNASKINDGASFLLLASEKALKEKNLKPIACVLGHSVFAQDPHWFTTAPVYATQKLLKQIGLTVDQIDLFEVNEAFSVVAMAFMKDLCIPKEKLNVHGGAVALGHPIGASGARILSTLLHALKTHNKETGIATICLGGGEAVSLAVKRL